MAHCKNAHAQSMLDGLFELVESDTGLSSGHPISGQWTINSQTTRLPHSVEMRSKFHGFEAAQPIRDSMNANLGDLRQRVLLDPDDEVFIKMELTQDPNIPSREGQLEDELFEKEETIARMREEMLQMATERHDLEHKLARYKLDEVRTKLDAGAAGGREAKFV